jgi:ABC-2 type transport system ATP-binding protein
MNAPIIKLNGLARSYETYQKREGLKASVIGFFNREIQRKVALHPVDLEVHKGEVVGLVGANGAGKTTLIKVLSGLIHPSSGECHVLGYEPFRRQHDYLLRMSVLLGQKAQLWWDIPPRDSFGLLGQIYGIDRNTLKSRINELADVLQVHDQLHVQLRRLSLGERMKMEFIGSLLHKPEVIFLDEPTIGLDIVAQSAIRAFLKEYVIQENPTIILTSHYMDDISTMASRLLLMSHGELVYDGTVQKFRNQTTTHQKLTLRLEDPLASDVMYQGRLALAAGETVFKGEMAAPEIAEFLTEVMKIGRIIELNIEQTDFEDVIHSFLAKESRVHVTRRSPTPGIQV